jgi:hypothetical protein
MMMITERVVIDTERFGSTDRLDRTTRLLLTIMSMAVVVSALSAIPGKVYLQLMQVPALDTAFLLLNLALSMGYCSIALYLLQQGAHKPSQFRKFENELKLVPIAA